MNLENLKSVPYKCNQSGSCCVNNLVMLNPFDIFRIAKHLNVTAKYLFQNRIFAYQIIPSTYWMEPTIQLKPNSACQFLYRDKVETEKLKCKVYESRPFTCRIFPLKFDPDNNIYLRGEKGENRCRGCVDESINIDLNEYLQPVLNDKLQEEYTEYRNFVESLSLRGYNIKEIKNKKDKQKIFFNIQALLYETFPTIDNEEFYPFEKVKEKIEEMLI
ncbi:MAG: YkgJ family cysteine cluster protein [Leptospiraceae bacterium]|nr:YkgJ family cysteine cluster protein [Leptospiraceae bacterium]